MSNSKTQDFLSLREETKHLVASILAEKMQHFDNDKKTEARVDGFGSLLVSMVSQGFCQACGSLYTPMAKPVTCCLCFQNFCSNCVKPLENETVAEVMDLIQAQNYACGKCTLMMILQQSSHERKTFQESKTKSPLVPLYSAYAEHKKSINTWIPQYEYLVSSIIEVQKSSNDQQKEDESWGASYNAVKTIERKLLEIFSQFQEAAVPLVNYKANTPTEERLIKGISQSYVDFLKVCLPKFQNIQRQVGREELQQTSKIYLFLQQLAFETQFHRSFSGQWNGIFQKAVTEIKKEIVNICIASAGESDWGGYEETLQKRIKRRQKLLKEAPSKALILQKALAKGAQLAKTIEDLSESILIRKVINLVKTMGDRFRIRRIQAPVTNKMLGFISHELESHFNSVVKG